MNVGNLSSGYESSIPCTPLGCYLLIKKIEPNLSGKKAVVVGRSNLNGKPMTQLLLKENCNFLLIEVVSLVYHLNLIYPQPQLFYHLN